MASDDEGAWDELVYTVRARLLTRTRGRYERASRGAPHALVVAAAHVAPWLVSHGEVARLCVAVRASGADGDAIWRAFFVDRRWAVARSPLGAGVAAAAVFARLPADVRALARERGAAATLVQTLAALERARRTSLLRRGWVGELRRHFVFRDVPAEFRGWERRRWRVSRSRRGHWTLEARRAVDGPVVWTTRLGRGGVREAVRRVSARDVARLGPARANPVDASLGGTLFCVTPLDLPILFQSADTGPVDDLAELLRVLAGRGDASAARADPPGKRIRATAASGIALFVVAAAAALAGFRILGFLRLLRGGGDAGPAD